MTPTEFWPALRLLAQLYDQQGLTPDERLESIRQQFLAAPPVAQRQLIADALRLSMDLPDLYAAVVSSANQREARGFFTSEAS